MLNSTWRVPSAEERYNAWLESGEMGMVLRFGKGDSIPSPVSTRRRIYGPAEVTLIRHEDGGIDCFVDKPAIDVALERLESEFSDWPREELVQVVISVSPNMSMEAQRVWERYHAIRVEMGR